MPATFGRMTPGMALVHRQTAAERDRGQTLLTDLSQVFLHRGHNLCDLPLVRCTRHVSGLSTQSLRRFNHSQYHRVSHSRRYPDAEDSDY
jgi:hypothetical protein